MRRDSKERLKGLILLLQGRREREEKKAIRAEEKRKERERIDTKKAEREKKKKEEQERKDQGYQHKNENGKWLWRRDRWFYYFKDNEEYNPQKSICRFAEYREKEGVLNLQYYISSGKYRVRQNRAQFSLKQLLSGYKRFVFVDAIGTRKGVSRYLTEIEISLNKRPEVQWMEWLANRIRENLQKYYYVEEEKGSYVTDDDIREFMYEIGEGFSVSTKEKRKYEDEDDEFNVDLGMTDEEFNA